MVSASSFLVDAPHLTGLFCAFPIARKQQQVEKLLESETRVPLADLLTLQIQGGVTAGAFYLIFGKGAVTTTVTRTRRKEPNSEHTTVSLGYKSAIEFSSIQKSTHAIEREVEKDIALFTLCEFLASYKNPLAIDLGRYIARLASLCAVRDADLADWLLKNFPGKFPYLQDRKSDKK